MTLTRISLVVATMTSGWATADDPAGDSIGRKLSAAKKEYVAETAKVLKTAGEALGKAENAARKKGDRVGAARLAAERKRFEEDKEFPVSGAVNLRKRLIAQQAKLEAAHEQAIRDYVKARDDKGAAEAAKSLSEFRQRFVGVVQLAPGKVYRIVNRASGLALSLKTPQAPKDSPLVQAAVADDPYQFWTVTANQHEGATVYAIRNVGCGLTVTVDDYSRNEGAPIVVFPEASEMRWRVTPRRGGLTLAWILSGHLISIADESKEPGDRVIQRSDQSTSLSQVWNFVEVDGKGR